MDVDNISFAPRLLQILEGLSQCHFVSIDLELSGVTSRSAGSKGKQTLQERYTETKEAAERYQILQVGLTFAHQDQKAKKYVLQAYNIPINPSLQDDLEVERIFSFQSGAVEFLLKNGFNIADPFHFGVPYLSRDEEKLAEQRAKARQDGMHFTDMVFEEGDTQALEFMMKIRKEIDQWLQSGTPDFHYFAITSRTIPSLDCSFPDLTSFDKRLVHQIVRLEYPHLISQGRSSAVVVRHLDEEREKNFQKERRKKKRAQIARAVGFRWIIEAMTGNSLQKIDLEWFAKDPHTGMAVFFDMHDYSSRFNRAAALLKERRPVLVGHNLFTDLVYVYQCFIGSLPDNVEEFRIRIHDLFPVIVDTKYMATHNCGSINPASSLEQIEETLRSEPVPELELHSEHRKYMNKEAFHEAGYDSYLTARIMVLLSAKLEAAGTYITSPTVLSEDDQEYHTAREELSASPGSPAPGGGVLLSMDGRDHTQNVGTSPTLATTSCKSGQAKKKKRNAGTNSKSRFAHETPYEALTRLTLEEESDPATPKAAISLISSYLNPAAQPFPPISRSSHVVTPGRRNWTEKNTEPDPFMPPFASDFWRVYANRLRIFGTEERFLDLDPLRGV